MTCYVYLIEQANSRYCKIGVSNEPARRLVELQRHNPDRMYVRYLLEVRSQSDAYQLEAYLHQKYSRCRRSGEWFNLRANQVVSVENMTDTMRALIVRVIEYPEWVIEPKPETPPWLMTEHLTPTRYVLMFALAWLISVYIVGGSICGAIDLTLSEVVSYWFVVFASTGGIISAILAAWGSNGHAHNGHGASAPEE